MKFFLIFLLLSFSFWVSGQDFNPKYEFRAVWVATVANIDWPSKPGLTTKQQKMEAINILEMHKKLGMNTVILQVRPAADAFYFSEIEPWSVYLTGIQGKAPKPYYDPLEFWISECHKRCMELHAWMNPFRVVLNHKQPLSVNHVAFKHPEWIIKYGNKLFFDPGLPQTRKYITTVVKDIVERYDVDAIHFDDYFYPYPLKEDFPDTASFRLYNRGFVRKSKADWRRENVDIVIKMVNDTIKKVKPWVKFGISPFGVWRNGKNDPNGSASRAGITNYDNLYADVIKWQKKGWIDYLLPQLYWHIGHPLVDFQKLAYWWGENNYGRAMYVGHALYKNKKQSNVKEWTESDELPQQVRIVRNIEGLGGSAFYSSKHFNRDLQGFQDSLMMDLYKFNAIAPKMQWIDNLPPVGVNKVKKWGRKLKWRVVEEKEMMDKPWRLVIYLWTDEDNFSKVNPEFIHAVVPVDCGKYKFKRMNRKKKKYKVAVTVLDRLNNESSVSDVIDIKL